MLLGPTHRSVGQVYFAWRDPELKFLHFKKIIISSFLVTFVERLISRGALGASQSQLYSAFLCLQVDSQRSSRKRLWMSDCSFTQRVMNIHWSGYSVEEPTGIRLWPTGL